MSFDPVPTHFYEYPESEEFWNKAPEDVTHFLPEHSVNKCTPFTWIKIDGNKTYFSYEENPNNWALWAYVDDYPEYIKAFIKRPTFPKKEETPDNQSRIPSVGEECRVEFENAYAYGYEGIVKSITEEWVILEVEDNGEVPFTLCSVTLKPLPKQKTIQEEMIDKWKLQSLDYSHDTTSSQYTLGYVFDFVVKNFKAEDKEEN